MNEEKMGVCIASKANRETTASKILSELERVAKRSHEIVQLVAERTNTVTSPASPAEDSGVKQDICVLPSLFSHIRKLTTAIDKALSEIEDNMRRIEL